MKSSFTPTQEAPVFEKSADTVPAPGSAAIAAAAASSAPVPASFFQNEGGLEGEFDRSDLQIPGLNLVQSVGPLSELFQPGQMVYNKEEVLGLPAEVTLLRLRKFFQEKLPYGSEVLPRRFNTQAEAETFITEGE